MSGWTLGVEIKLFFLYYIYILNITLTNFPFEVSFYFIWICSHCTSQKKNSQQYTNNLVQRKSDSTPAGFHSRSAVEIFYSLEQKDTRYFQETLWDESHIVTKNQESNNISSNFKMSCNKMCYLKKVLPDYLNFDISHRSHLTK